MNREPGRDGKEIVSPMPGHGQVERAVRSPGEPPRIGQAGSDHRKGRGRGWRCILGAGREGEGDEDDEDERREQDSG